MRHKYLGETRKERVIKQTYTNMAKKSEMECSLRLRLKQVENEFPSSDPSQLIYEKAVYRQI